MKRASGFSLIEVLVAIAVVGLISTAAMTAVVSSLRHDRDSRVRTQAVATANSWLDRFRAKSLEFAEFSEGLTFPYGYDYSADALISHSSDPNAEETNQAWQPFKFEVRTVQQIANPVIWRVDVTTYYQTMSGGEAHVKLSTLVKQ